MRKIASLVFIFSFIFSLTALSQSTRKELSKEMKSKAIKEARKEAKKLGKQGWYVPPGSLPLEKLIESAWMKQLEAKEDGSSRYIFADGNGVAESKSAAEMQAIELGKLLLAGQIETQMNALISANVGNAQLSTEEAASVTEVVASAKNIIATELGYVNPTFKLYRDVSKGTVEVQSRLFYDTEQSLQIAKKVVREELKNKLKLNEEKLEKLMGF